MHQRHYGTGGYSPSHYHHGAEKRHVTAKAHGKARKFLTKILKPLIALLIVILIILWFILGDFRFIITRFPTLTGFPLGSRTYLVLFQNNFELRPTGGFISTYGELKFKNGIYKGIEFHDVYGTIDDHPYVEPPLVLGALLDGEGYQGHTFRDANFDPDFRLTKNALIDFYAMTNPGTRIDGIIAADFTFLEDMVSLYEPLKVEEYTLTKANLFETLSTVASDIDRHNEEALANRKNISGPIVKKIIKKSVIFPWRLSKFLNISSKAFDEKHLLVTSNRKHSEKIFAKKGWNGALPASSIGDFLVVNDANYGGMKSNRYILRDVTYELTVTEKRDVLGNPVIDSKVTVNLSHEGTWNIPLSGPYTGYLRVMIPMGSDIKSGGSVTEKRDDVSVLGDLTDIQPGETQSFTYEYELPEYVWNDGTYYLHLSKQAGTLADHYRVIVRLPQGESMESNQFDIRENVAFFETNLLTDLDLSFSILEDKNPPRIVSHEITAMNEITIVFNEPISSEAGENPFNYEIKDTDYADPNQSDTVSISSIRVDGSAVIIRTSGMTSQPDERYSVMLRDLKDTKSNFIEENPRTVTVVQRKFEEETTDTSMDTPADITEDTNG